MIITLNTRSEFMPGKLIVEKRKGVYGVVLSLEEIINSKGEIPIRAYKVKSLTMSRYSVIRKLQLYIIKNAFK